MIKMAQMLNDQAGEAQIPKGVLTKGWKQPRETVADGKNKKGEKLQYYITCSDPKTGKTNTMSGPTSSTPSGISSPSAKSRSFRRTGPKRSQERSTGTIAPIWAGPCARRKTANPWNQIREKTSIPLPITSSPAFGLLRHGKREQGLYKHMDRVVFDYGIPWSPRTTSGPSLKKEAGESAPGPHTSSRLSRPGAVWTHLVLQHIKDLQAQKGTTIIDSKSLVSFPIRTFKRGLMPL